MANKRSAKKEYRKNLKRRFHNKSIRSRVRTYAHYAEQAITKGSFDESIKLIRLYESFAMKAAKTKILSKLAVSRKVSRLVLSAKSKKTD